jgi:hypothetical protein
MAACAAGAAQELRWPVTVPGGVSRIEWEGEAVESAGATPVRDRLKLTQAVLPAVPLRVWQAALVQLDGKVSVPMATPADALPGVGNVTVGLQSKLSGTLPGLKRFFQTYPYSCLEQKASRALGLHDTAAWATLRDELPGYLDSDGLAYYFPPAPGTPPRGSDRLTAYVVSAAHEAGAELPEAAREAMLRGLAAFVEGRLERRFTTPRADLDMRKMAALEALSRHGRTTPRMLGSIAWTPTAWPTSTLLDAWGLYRRTADLPERAARLDELQRLVRSRLVAGGTTLKFTTEADDDWWWLMDGPDSNAARLVLAAAETAAWKDELPLLVSGALARQKRGAWLTTTANLWGVLALEKFSAKFESVMVTGRSSLQTGNAMRTQDWKATPEGGTQSLPWPTGASTYTMRRNASGSFGLPPTRVEAMYAPETFGELPNAVLEVKP